jgi:hypothetical protein
VRSASPDAPQRGTLVVFRSRGVAKDERSEIFHQIGRFGVRVPDCYRYGV